MPTLEQLETFKRLVNELGDEARLLAERGETIENVQAPDNVPDADLENLLADEPMDDGGGTAEMDALLGGMDFSADAPLDDDASDDFPDLDAFLSEEPPSLPDSPENFSSLVDEFTDDSEDLGDPAGLDDFLGGADEPPDSPPSFETDDDFSDLDSLDDMGEFAELDDLAEPAEPGDLPAEIEDVEPPDESGELLDDFGDIPGLEGLDGLGDFGESTESLETSHEIEDFSDPDGFDEIVEPSLPPTGVQGPDETLGAANGEPSLEDFSLDDLDGLPSDDSLDLDDFDVEDETAPQAPLDDAHGFDNLDDLDDAEEVEELGDAEEVESLDEFVGDLEIPGADLEIPDVSESLDSLEEEATAEDMDPLLATDDIDFDEELGEDLLSDIRDTGEESQQFSLDDFGDQYSFNEDEKGFTDDLGVDLDRIEESLDAAATEQESKVFGLDEGELSALRRSLASLPRNLKLALEEILVDERRSEEDVSAVVDALLADEPPKVLVALVRNITKRHIVLPKGYEKRTGAAFEARQTTLVWQLVKQGWPVVRIMLLVITALWFVFAAGFSWIYRPLKAAALYRQGLSAVAVDEIETAEGFFEDAWFGWPLVAPRESDGDRIRDASIIVNGWPEDDQLLAYARAFRRRKHWDEAQDYYSRYVARNPSDTEELLEYTDFLSRVLGRYQEAVDALDAAMIRKGQDFDRDLVLAQGDVFLHWAEDDPRKFEEARFRYAKVLEYSRNDEKAILSMMRYQLRIGNQEEIELLIPIFDHDEPGQTRNPALAAEVFAELGAFTLARQRESDARRFLNLALAADPTQPAATYYDALYWRAHGDEDREMTALRRTLVNLEGLESFSRGDLEKRILALGGMGRIHTSIASRLVAVDPDASEQALALARTDFTKAIDLYEDARNRNLLGATTAFGRLYLDVGNLYFRGIPPQGDLAYTLVPLPESYTAHDQRAEDLRTALAYYDEAERLISRGGTSVGSSLPDESLYNRAFARYVLGDDRALVDFNRVVRRRPDSIDARLALATALLAQGDYEASRSQYARTLELLEQELRRTGGVLEPFERPSHGELLLRFATAWNNLGVGRARSAARGGGDDDYAAALGAFTMASEYLDEVYTDMGDLIARGAPAMRDLDQRRIIQSSVVGGRAIPAESATIPYLNRLRLLGLEEAEGSYLMFTDIPGSLIF